MPSWSAIQSIHDRACDAWRMTNWKIITYDSLQASIIRQILTCRSAWSSRGSGTWMVHSHSYHTSRSFSGQPSSPSHVLPVRSEHAQNACSRAAVLAVERCRWVAAVAVMDSSRGGGNLNHVLIFLLEKIAFSMKKICSGILTYLTASVHILLIVLWCNICRTAERALIYTSGSEFRQFSFDLVESRWFNVAILLVIFINTIAIGIQTSAYVIAKAGNSSHPF